MQQLTVIRADDQKEPVRVALAVKALLCALQEAPVIDFVRDRIIEPAAPFAFDFVAVRMAARTDGAAILTIRGALDFVRAHPRTSGGQARTILLEIFKMRIGGSRSAPAQLAHACLHDHSAGAIPNAVLCLPGTLRADACRVRPAAPPARVQAALLRLAAGVAVGALRSMRLRNLSANSHQERATTVSGRAPRRA